MRPVNWSVFLTAAFLQYEPTFELDFELSTYFSFRISDSLTTRSKNREQRTVESVARWGAQCRSFRLNCAFKKPLINPASFETGMPQVRSWQHQTP